MNPGNSFQDTLKIFPGMSSSAAATFAHSTTPTFAEFSPQVNRRLNLSSVKDSKKDASTIVVMVSGSRFSIISSLFERVQTLAWYEYRGKFHLRANPDVFEALLLFLQRGKLPDIQALSAKNLEELALLASSLPSDTTELTKHIESRPKNEKKSKKSSSDTKNGLVVFSRLSRKKRNADEESPAFQPSDADVHRANDETFAFAASAKKKSRGLSQLQEQLSISKRQIEVQNASLSLQPSVSTDSGCTVPSSSSGSNSTPAASEEGVLIDLFDQPLPVVSNPPPVRPRILSCPKTVMVAKKEKKIGGRLRSLLTNRSISERAHKNICKSSAHVL